MQLLLWASIYLFTSTVLAHVTVQPFSKGNLTRGQEQFKRGSVTGSEVKACTQRADTDQLMSTELPLSKKTVHISQPPHWLWDSVLCRNWFNSRIWNTGRWHQQAALGYQARKLEIKNRYIKKRNCIETRKTEGTGWSPDLHLSHAKILAYSLNDQEVWLLHTSAAITRVIIQYNKTQTWHNLMWFLESQILRSSTHSFIKGSTDQTFDKIAYYKPI